MRLRATVHILRIVGHLPGLEYSTDPYQRVLPGSFPGLDRFRLVERRAEDVAHVFDVLGKL